MSIEPVFLLSLPRSGSTIVQRALGSHSRIATTSAAAARIPAHPGTPSVWRLLLGSGRGRAR